MPSLLVPKLDDGSVAALREILAGMAGSPAALPFLAGYLAPQGRLDGERGWTTVAMLSFDDDRVGLVRALAARATAIDAARLAAVVRPMSFDEGRTKVVQALAGKAAPVPASVARDVVAMFSFDEGRQAACAAMAKDGGLQVSIDQLAALARLFSFDEGRLDALRALAPHLQNPSNAQRKGLLATFSFSSSRETAAGLLQH